MESLSKRRLDAPALDALLHRSLGQGGRLERELTGGMFNTAYRARLFDGRTVLVKIAPPADLPVLRYERGILGTEAAVYRQLNSPTGARVPTPRLLHAGVDHLVLSWLDGSPWDQTEPHRPDLLRRELGQLTALINAIPSPDGRFGYPAPESALQADDWPAAFSLMTAALLTDAERFGAELGTPAKEFTALVDASQERLAEVAVSRLVHFDLWPGNVFHDGTRITGLIDHERAFFGDPAAELVSLEFGGAAGGLPGGGRRAGVRPGPSPPARALPCLLGPHPGHRERAPRLPDLQSGALRVEPRVPGHPSGRTAAALCRMTTPTRTRRATPAPPAHHEAHARQPKCQSRLVGCLPLVVAGMGACLVAAAP
ncbi:aminoglycoside phosphotransferase family protein [Kitasatospora sp. NPDC050463]|uniref:phosphotransferase family protein n=1 Tax=Kitasatospora sp. NPDC050463 TaxID=3155786 RepID=UPI0033E2F9D4